MGFYEDHSVFADEHNSWADGYVHCMSYNELKEVLQLRYSREMVSVVRIYKNCFTMDKVIKILTSVNPDIRIISTESVESGSFKRLIEQVESVKEIVTNSKLQNALIRIVEMNVSTYGALIESIKKIGSLLNHIDDYQTQMLIVTEIIPFKINDFCVMNTNMVAKGSQRFLALNAWQDFVAAIYQEDFVSARNKLRIFAGLLFVDDNDIELFWNGITKAFGIDLALVIEISSSSGTKLVPLRDINWISDADIKIVNSHFYNIDRRSVTRSIQDSISPLITVHPLSNDSIATALSLFDGNIGRVFHPGYLESIVVGSGINNELSVLYEVKCPDGANLFGRNSDRGLLIIELNTSQTMKESDECVYKASIVQLENRENVIHVGPLKFL